MVYVITMFFRLYEEIFNRIFSSLKLQPAFFATQPKEPVAQGCGYLYRQNFVAWKIYLSDEGANPMNSLLVGFADA